jgi:hypothetical protein
VEWAGRSLYGPVVPDRRLTLGWTAITVHWLSGASMPTRFVIFQSGDRARARCADAALAGGNSGAEALFRMIDSELRELVDRGTLRSSELGRIFYPTWNRTSAEFLEPLAGSDFTLAECREDATTDSDRYPQFVRDGDARAFAAAYIGFVRAITEPSFFRWIEPDRAAQQKSAIVEAFYAGLERRIAADPASATCHWHTVTMRLVRK